VELTVENTGKKLTPELVSTLTEPFLRSTDRVRTDDAGTADHGGVGLGLAIVKSIAQAHDGMLTLTPRPAGGLRVTVRLPAAYHTPAPTDEAPERRYVPTALRLARTGQRAV
jgi:two-component system, OmpR family, sensor histidine kinase VanS